MGLVYLLILLAIVGASFYITFKAIGEAESIPGFSIWRFIIQATLAGVPAVLWVLTLGSSSQLNSSVIVFIIVFTTIHVLYCIKLFGASHGIAVTICSMVSAFIIVIMMIFALEKIKRKFQSHTGKGNK